MTVTARNGIPIAGAVYGLYRSGSTLVQELVTDAYGIATSNDVTVETTTDNYPAKADMKITKTGNDVFIKPYINPLCKAHFGRLK